MATGDESRASPLACKDQTLEKAGFAAKGVKGSKQSLQHYQGIREKSLNVHSYISETFNQALHIAHVTYCTTHVPCQGSRFIPLAQRSVKTNP